MTQLSEQFLEFARCPETQSKLELASEDLIRQVNDLINAGQLSDCADQAITSPLEVCLVNADRSLIYPVRNGIVVLTTDRAIKLLENLQ